LRKHVVKTLSAGAQIRYTAHFNIAGRLMVDPRAAVLIIDDEVQTRRYLSLKLELAGFSVLEAENGKEGIGSAATDLPALIILNPILPDDDGAEIVRRIRSWSNVPIVILSKHLNAEDKVRLLELGADDFIVKPYSMPKLVARVHAAIRSRQFHMSSLSARKIGPLTIDFASRAVSVDGQRITLTRKEYNLLRILAKHAGEELTHEQLLNEIWDVSQVVEAHSLRNLIRKLRKKIKVESNRRQLILTESGVGYRLCSDMEWISAAS
jgi:two-component system KDP operon response regulator KdpE